MRQDDAGAAMADDLCRICCYTPRMPTADLHLHTHHSHGTADVAAMVQACLDRGIQLVGMTEHAPRPAGFRYPAEEFQAHVLQQFSQYVAEVLAARQAFPQAEILLGTEVDYVAEHEDFFEQFLQSAPFDYTLGGVHFIGPWGFDFAQAEWDVLDEDARRAAYLDYYALVAGMARSRRYTVAPHVDLVKIFSRETHARFLDSADGRRAVGEALDALAQAGMLLEISTAGLRKPCREIYPGPTVLGWAMERGLACCPASDAHAPNQVAFAFDTLTAYAREHGVEGWTVPGPCHAGQSGRRRLPL
ncbi:histidinol-phosphatase [Megalodesulfovibrio gigas]|nr:histidinol-phosphatase [Megalodesulfovibrio gigas]